MQSDAQAREQFGKNGRDFIVSRMSRETTARQYLDVLASLTGMDAAANLAARPVSSGETL